MRNIQFCVVHSEVLVVVGGTVDFDLWNRLILKFDATTLALLSSSETTGLDKLHLGRGEIISASQSHSKDTITVKNLCIKCLTFEHCRTFSSQLHHAPGKCRKKLHVRRKHVLCMHPCVSHALQFRSRWEQEKGKWVLKWWKLLGCQSGSTIRKWTIKYKAKVNLDENG